jgi:hypothetical protein
MFIPKNLLSVASRMRFVPMSSWIRPQSWVHATKRAKEAQLFVSSQNRKPSFIPHTKPVIPTPPTPLKI